MSSLSQSCEHTTAGQTITLPAGKTGETYFGPYRLLEKLGAGGMGEVYLAEDARLGRKIALKMLPEEFTRDAGRVRRFVREAKAASALNHPNIITIFDIGKANGKHYTVTEYIQGQTLRHLITAPVTIAMALDIGIQMASALNAAHEAGIIHRDIKPENIMLRPDGLVKVLDFGIAKLIEKYSPATSADGDEGELSASNEYATELDLYLTTPGTKSDGTAPGIILGTVTYMSPEQLRGQEIDARSEIFSLGIVLYEVIAGMAPFVGHTQADRIAAILEHEPEPLADHRPDVPAEMEQIIGKALRKDRDFRYQSTKDLLIDLKELKQDLEFKEKLERSVHADARDKFEATGILNRQWWKPTAASLAAVAIIAVLIASGLYSRPHRAAPLTDRDTVVLADFINTTGDPIFDGTLRQSLASQLEQSPFLKLLPEDRIAQTLSLMARPRDVRLSHQVAREVGQRTASRATIEGYISGSGSRYELELKAVDCQSRSTLAEVQATANSKQQVLRELGKAAAKLREQLGESLASVQKYDAPVESVTTGSLEALQVYSLGLAAQAKADFRSATAFLEQSVSIDPNIAMAYSRLAASYSYTGEAGRAMENARKAYELRQRVSEREMFYIESIFLNLVTEDLEAGRKVNELWAQTYPRDPIPLNHLYDVYIRLGEYEKGLSAIQQSLGLDPENGIAYVNLANVYILLNRLDEAKATIEEALSKNIDSPEIRRSLYLISFMQNDTAGMERETAFLISKPGWESNVLQLESETAATAGQFSRAREMVRRAIDSSQRTGSKETASGFQAQAALREALAGNLALAKGQAQDALSLSDNIYVRAVSAIVLGLAGESRKAARLADDLAQRYPESANMQFYHLPMIRGAVAIQGGNSAGAIDALAVAAPYEMGSPRSVNFFTLYPIYLRGQAYLSARQGAKAAAEFQKILDRPGLVMNKLIGPLAHLGLGRAYAMAGDSAKARTAYQDFLALWKDADPDIPILKQARVEYERLIQGPPKEWS